MCTPNTYMHDYRSTIIFIVRAFPLTIIVCARFSTLSHVEDNGCLVLGPTGDWLGTFLRKNSLTTDPSGCWLWLMDGRWFYSTWPRNSPSHAPMHVLKPRIQARIASRDFLSAKKLFGHESIPAICWDGRWLLWSLIVALMTCEGRTLAEDFYWPICQTQAVIIGPRHSLGQSIIGRETLLAICLDGWWYSWPWSLLDNRSIARHGTGLAEGSPWLTTHCACWVHCTLARMRGWYLLSATT